MLDSVESTLGLINSSQPNLPVDSSIHKNMTGGDFSGEQLLRVGFSSPQIGYFRSQSIDDQILGLCSIDPLNMAASLSISSLQPRISQADIAGVVEDAKDLLLNWKNSEQFTHQVETAFDKASDSEAVAELIQQMADGTLENMPLVQVGSAKFLGDKALGSYEASTNTITLFDGLFSKGVPVPGIATIVLVEELAHFLDSEVNGVDSAGDEGAIVSAFVQGIELSDKMLDLLKQEDDSVTYDS